MTTTARAFHEFIVGLELTKAEQDEASRQQNVVRENLRRHLPIVRDFLSGSYSRATAIRPLHDIDVFLVIDHASQWPRVARDPQILLTDVQRALGTIYPEKPIAKLQGRSVNIPFIQTGIGYDLVPAFETRPGVYSIPDRQRSSWISTNPEAHRAACVAANQRAGGRLNALIKATKHWNVQAGKPLRSFHIEAMSYSAFQGAPTDHRSGLLQLLRHLVVAVLQPCPDPAGLGPNVDADLDWAGRFKAQGALQRAVENAAAAIRLEDSGQHEAANTQWAQMFGNAYPTRRS